MKKIFEKIWAFLKDSNHWKHLVGGMGIGLGADDWYCNEYASIGVGSALEFKDWQHGGKFDWVDMVLVVIGANITHGIKALLF